MWNFANHKCEASYLKHAAAGRLSLAATKFGPRSMAVIVLAVHNMCTPRKESDVLSDFFELFRFSVDDDDRVLRGIGKIYLLILSIRRCCFQLDVHANPDTARGPETVHVVDVNEAAG